MHICDHRHHPIHTLKGPVDVISKLVHCPDPACEGRQYEFVARGRWILVSGQGALHRLDPSDGSVLWKTSLPDVRYCG